MISWVPSTHDTPRAYWVAYNGFMGLQSEPLPECCPLLSPGHLLCWSAPAGIEKAKIKKKFCNYVRWRVLTRLAAVTVSQGV